ncbi:MAG: hypothetical protein QOE70_567 [Chthoniobacter sp.]|jgi:hypothetical protein|nr:hypothetical protein [Chthoniobacter sp.]
MGRETVSDRNLPKLDSENSSPPLRIATGLSVFHTSNASLVRERAQSAAYLVGEVATSYQWKFGEDWVLDLRAKQKVFRYNKLRHLDYESLNMGPELSRNFERLGDVKLFAKYNFQRLTDHFGEEFYRDHTIELGVEKTVDWRDGYVYAGYSSTLGWADPRAAQRDEHGLYLGSWFDFSRDFGGEIYYRAALYDYIGGRRDLYQTAEASLVWDFTEHTSLNASFSWTRDRSSRAGFGYDEWNPGGGLSLRIRF